MKKNKTIGKTAQVGFLFGENTLSLVELDDYDQLISMHTVTLKNPILEKTDEVMSRLDLMKKVCIGYLKNYVCESMASIMNGKLERFEIVNVIAGLLAVMEDNKNED